MLLKFEYKMIILVYGSNKIMRVAPKVLMLSFNAMAWTCRCVFWAQEQFWLDAFPDAINDLS